VERARILVVEDSKTQQDWLVQVLARENYQIDTASDGREAIRKARTTAPDLVLLDMVLPDMEGLEVLRMIKARPDERFVPVILLSVKSDLDSRVTGLRIGADDFLAKPFADSELLARTNAMLRIKALQDTVRAQKAELERLSVTDGLTGLFNRRFFQERLDEEFRRAQRYSDPVSLIMIDIDHFKRVNDRYGHQAGDVVLKGTADLLRETIRDPDISARFGGEEFAVILPKTHLSGALTVAERIWRGMGQKVYQVSGSIHGPPGEGAGELRVTASLGISFYPSKDVTSSELLVRYADEALYKAKHEGRNTICLYQAQAYRYDADKGPA
jgi:diguanylate cyclase (GGDEF)-like protein